MEVNSQRLILFDVDQTLVSLRGGSTKALNSAFEEVHGIPDAFSGMTFAGGLDLPLMKEMYLKWQLTPGDAGALPDLTDFKSVYSRHLRELLETWTDGEVCPGVPVLLEALASEPDVQLGLETGNFRESAFIKLRKFGLDSYFQDGGFGGDHMDRTEVVASAIVACQKSSGRTYSNNQIFVVGDTPSDVRAGQANHVRTLAVATGQYSPDELRKHNPSHLLHDLSDTSHVQGLLLSPWIPTTSNVLPS